MLRILYVFIDVFQHVCDLMHPCDMDIRTPVSVNSARWLPYVGEGIVYGTNRGDLHICRPGYVQFLIFTLKALHCINVPRRGCFFC